MSRPVAPFLLLTCEHGGNRIPREYRRLFANAGAVLRSHRGLDIGALGLARSLARETGAPLIFSETSRLLVELNRTLGHPRIFSEFSRVLSPAERDRLVAKHYLPFRRSVEELVAAKVRKQPVAHVSVHSFTPVLNERTRRTDIGLLFDPGRPAESRLAELWRSELKQALPARAIHRNLPYRGTSDGFTVALRKVHPDERYMGIEIEVNQRHALGPKREWGALQRAIAASLRAALDRYRE